MGWVEAGRMKDNPGPSPRFALEYGTLSPLRDNVVPICFSRYNFQYE